MPPTTMNAIMQKLDALGAQQARTAAALERVEAHNSELKAEIARLADALQAALAQDDSDGAAGEARTNSLDDEGETMTPSSLDQ